jgi:ABC-type sugar transport system ATPase subunit
VLEVRGITKAYGGVTALREASLRVRPGTVHALLGENGAGKSTLVKIIAGAERPDSGVVLLDGIAVSFASTAEAARSGVAVVSQELALFPDLDVLLNLFAAGPICRGPLLRRSAMAGRAAPVLAELGLEVGFRQLAGSLPLADRQRIEIARALLTSPRILILDEPTSAQEAAGTENLLNVVRVLRDRGVGVVFVSHILEEVLSLSDEVTILRDGAVVVAGAGRSSLTIPMVVAAMLGDRKLYAHPAADGRAVTRAVADAETARPPGTADPPEAGAPPEAAAARPRPAAFHDHGNFDALVPAETSVLMETAAAGPPGMRAAGDLRVEHVSVRRRLDDVSLTARPGEVVGLAGLAGAGQRALLDVVRGLSRPRRGTVRLPSGAVCPRRFRLAVAQGVALVTGDRRRFGLMLDKPVWENIGQVRSVALARDGIYIRRSVLQARARDQMERLGIRAAAGAPAGSLSGGNQQKAVFAKWLEAEPQMLVLDDPTRGVDVGAKAEMHRLIRSIAASGAVVLLCSTEADELASLCERVLVFYRGRITGELTAPGIDSRAVLEAINTGQVVHV